MIPFFKQIIKLKQTIIDPNQKSSKTVFYLIKYTLGHCLIHRVSSALQLHTCVSFFYLQMHTCQELEPFS